VEKFATAIGLRQDDEEACFDQDQQELDNISYDKTGRSRNGIIIAVVFSLLCEC
jgi:hypothetical protein